MVNIPPIDYKIGNGLTNDDIFMEMIQQWKWYMDGKLSRVYGNYIFGW